MGQSTTRIALTTESLEPASNLSEEAERLIQSVIDWVDHCVPGDEWQMPQDWLPDSDELRQAADYCVRQRHPNLRIWRTGKDRLVCKVWFGAEPPMLWSHRKLHHVSVEWTQNVLRLCGVKIIRVGVAGILT